MSVDVDKPAQPPADAPPPPESIKAIPVRHYGRWVAALVVIGLVALLFRAFASGNVNWGAIPQYMFNGDILKGLRNTLLITVLSMIIGIVLGVILAVMRQSKNPVTSTVAWFYVWFFRGTPVYVQLFLWFNLGLVFQYIDIMPIYKDEWSDFMTPFLCALLGLGLNEAAYMAEICRAGLNAVDEGQTEAAHALGMSHGKTLRRIIVPQAMRVIVPPTGNEVINMLKTSSLVIAVQYYDLLQAAQNVGRDSGVVVEMLILAATWYLIATTVLSIGQYYLERYYARGSSRQLPPTPLQRAKARLSGGFNRSAGGVG
ncbi:amino acid ABC transporter permease [Streptomyces sp. NPDC001739]|uniref:Histidine/lysine/arginine/ornithine transport system permease protein HisM n=3 Tax=Streptomyces TaxID=1883 RepID=A0ABM8A155_STRNI|nr:MULTISPECIES: amino acid ABC transporter permease [Streptomyces]MBL1088407.1 amino acid ABC transporter permease [Streptomyces sp. 9-7]MEE4424110.1 amino acid ABC transporter permease [Streptomyces sp. DSM 41528]BDM72301.1 permease [Streptomyces nigrescens]